MRVPTMMTDRSGFRARAGVSSVKSITVTWVKAMGAGPEAGRTCPAGRTVNSSVNTTSEFSIHCSDGTGSAGDGRDHDPQALHAGHLADLRMVTPRPTKK